MSLSSEDLRNEKQALPSQIESTSSPPLKRSHHSSHSTSDLNSPCCAGPPSKSLREKTCHKEQGEESKVEVEESSSEECTILPQHHELPCVRAEC
ncbi:unnamed protein product [Knipowitschia caucasica]